MTGTRLLASLRALLAFVAASFLIAAPAQAAVELTFYAKEMGGEFPHGFVRLTGTPDRGGAVVDTAYGFTATAVTPAILFGRVGGRLEVTPPNYVRSADPHLAVTLTDAEYDAVLATVARWQALEQPSYSLKRRNCVHFVADVAGTLGMQANVPENLTRRPKGFLESLIRRNRDWLAARHARIIRDPGEERVRD